MVMAAESCLGSRDHPNTHNWHSGKFDTSLGLGPPTNNARLSGKNFHVANTTTGIAVE